MATATPDLDLDLEQLLEIDTALDTPYDVVLHNDDVNTFEYVIVVLVKVFSYSPAKAKRLAEQTHTQGRSVVWNGEREQAVEYARTLCAQGLTATCRKAA